VTSQGSELSEALNTDVTNALNLNETSSKADQHIPAPIIDEQAKEVSAYDHANDFGRSLYQRPEPRRRFKSSIVHRPGPSLTRSQIKALRLLTFHLLRSMTNSPRPLLCPLRLRPRHPRSQSPHEMQMLLKTYRKSPLRSHRQL
jgi:hypothetical protein